jgi:hypothetical protein
MLSQNVSASISFVIERYKYLIKSKVRVTKMKEVNKKGSGCARSKQIVIMTSQVKEKWDDIDWMTYTENLLRCELR